MRDLTKYPRRERDVRAEFWAHKQAEAERLARLEKWEEIFKVKLFPEILLKR